MTAGRRHAVLLVAAVCAYVPIVLSSPGAVGADTKTYLYIDPSRVLRSASSLWDSDVALGTVTHQNIGYLWPMGPFYWIFEALGSPDWFAQRMWLATLLFAAGAGVCFLLRTLGWEGRGLLVAVLAYELSPYLLDYSARISAVLLPWAGLPWLLALTIRSARSGGWRHPAQFALVVVTVGSVNATSLLLVGIAPVAWLFHARVAERSLSTRAAVGAALRIGVLSAGVSLWWIAGLVLQGGYSLPVTRYTETYQTVASSSTAPEVFRGLGYWFFYGNDKFGQWIEPSIEYTQGVWLLFVSFGLVVLALLGAAVLRWRHRSYFVLLIVLGGLMAVGSHPFDAPSPLGALFKDFTRTDAGLALRSTPRALPMLVLATSVLLGALVNGVHRRWPGLGRPVALVVLAAVVLNNPAMWRVRMIEEHLQRDEELPTYWLDAIDSLDSSGRDGRVMELPGSDFASYRWGNTVDPITPGILERGYVARELVPFGSPESAALLTAFDRRFQEDTIDTDAIVPIAQLISVDDIVHRADLTYERFRTPRPVPTADLLNHTADLGAGEGFGPPVPNAAGPQQTMRDEVMLAIDPSLPDPAPVTVYPVPDALDIVRTRPLLGPTVVVGDAEGLVDAAGAGLVRPDAAVWFGAELAIAEGRREAVLAEPAAIIITDSNKRRARRWGTLRENLGPVERAGETPLVDDPTDNRLEIFDGVEAQRDVDVDDTRTVSVQPGPFSLRASNYGNPVTYTNDDRPALAIDGDPATAWVVGAFAEARGEWLEFSFAEPTQVPQVRLLQPVGPGVNRHITEVEIRADGEVLTTVRLDAAQQGPDGQVVALAPHDPALVYEIELTDLDFPRQPSYNGISAVGFAEVELGAIPPVLESLRTPVALVQQLGDDLDRHDLSVVLTRERSNPQEPVRSDPELEMRRDVVLPVDREFALTGTARLSASVEESMIDALIGRDRSVTGGALSARSSGRLPGDLRSAASFAFDGDASTAWTAGFGPQAGQWVEVSAEGPTTFSDLAVVIVSDDQHSVPTTLRVLVDGEPLGDFPTGLQIGDAPLGSVTSVVLPISATGNTIRLEVVDVDEQLTRDWYSNGLVAMPVSLAEIDLGEDARFGPPADIATECVAVAEIDGVVATARLAGSAADALDRKGISLAGCTPIEAAGSFTIQTMGRVIGFDIDQIVMRSRRELAPIDSTDPVEVLSNDDTNYRVRVPPSATDRWLVLGQSHNEGWEASIAGQVIDGPVLIDGFANGWLVPAGEEVDVVLEWTPQSLVGRSLMVSAAIALLALVLAVVGRRESGAVDARRPLGPEYPQISVLSTGRQRRPATRLGVAVAVAAGAAGFAFLNLPRLPVLAVAVGLVAFAGLRWRGAFSVPASAATAVLGLTALAIMVAQRRFRYPPGFGWPQQFADLHVYGVLALLLLGADYLVSLCEPVEGPTS